MNTENDILDKKLHTFGIEELSEIRKISDTIFEPLVRPFRQHRISEEFSFKETIFLLKYINDICLYIFIWPDYWQFFKPRNL